MAEGRDHRGDFRRDQMDDPITERLERIYRAIDALQEVNLEGRRIPVKITDQSAPEAGPNGWKRTFSFDFKAGATEADLANWLHQAIGLVAGLRDHLKRWAKTNGKSQSDVESFFDGSPSLCILIDLWNLEKHGGKGRKSLSGHSPELRNIMRVLQMKADAGVPKPVFSIALSGQVTVTSGTSFVVVADVVDEHGTKIGEANKIIEQGLTEIERLLSNLGVSLKA
jgi:hypothetical protein